MLYRLIFPKRALKGRDASANIEKKHQKVIDVDYEEID